MGGWGWGVNPDSIWYARHCLLPNEGLSPSEDWMDGGEGRCGRTGEGERGTGVRMNNKKKLNKKRKTK